MVDLYEFIVRESVVSSSQDDLLKRLPGWHEQAAASPSSSPSQAPLALSRLCGSGSSSDEEEHAAAPASAFCVQEPLEWASPEDDSYNPAFESDRSQSLSPLAPLHAYGDLWASRLITQSQNDAVMSHFGLCDLLLAEGAPKKNPPQVAEVGVELSHRQGKTGRTQNPKAVALSDAHHATPSRDIPNGSHCSADHEKDHCKTKILDDDGELQNNVEPVDQSASHLLDQIKSVTGAVEEPATDEATFKSRTNSTAAEATSFCVVENIRKRKDDDGDCAFATTTEKLQGPNYEPQHSKLASEANHHEVRGPQSKKQLGEDCMAGSTNAKCLLPLSLVSGKENISSTYRFEKSTHGETEMVRDNAAMDHTATRVFPESVMDVMMLVSDTLPTPSPHDPDFLSIVMSTGVSLSLPFRDCSGRLISNMSTG